MVYTPKVWEDWSKYFRGISIGSEWSRVHIDLIKKNENIHNNTWLLNLIFKGLGIISFINIDLFIYDLILKT